MGWDALIVGDLTFPVGAVGTWKNTAALAVDYDWPDMIAGAMDSSMYEADPTVADVLRDIAQNDHYWGSFVADGDTARIRYNVDGSNYSMVAERVVRALCAAAQVGASGRVLFCDQGGAWGGFFEGALVELADGELVTEEKNGPFGAKDKAVIKGVLESMSGGSIAPKASRAAAKTAPTKKTPAKKKPAKKADAKKAPAKNVAKRHPAGKRAKKRR